MKVSIIGCGLIGRKRALALTGDDHLIACCDVDQIAAEKFSQEFHCQYFTDYSELLENIVCDIVIVAVVNKYTKEIVIQALKTGRHVLAEKPLGRNLSEAREMVSYATGIQLPSYPLLKTGFNHRFHPAIWKAKQKVTAGEIGKIFSIRARYGHGGRPGMEKEWRASKELCGGGELLDQGVHVIDLIRWFGGEIKEVYGKVETKFWNMEVEDNAYAILKTDTGLTASLHVSWTNWKNIFSFEVFGTDGYIRVEGLGGSYGPETLEIGKRRKEGGRPDTETIEFPVQDVSWRNEWEEFKSAIEEHRQPIGNGLDGIRANAVVEALYHSQKENRVIFLT